ncbi:MAG: aerial mycelium formation protein [Actinomycetota bacterium]
MTDDHPRNRRIDRVLEPSFVQGLNALALDDLRGRRDEALSEREHLSLLRRMLQGRSEILRAEMHSRASSEDEAPLVERLSEILADDEPAGPSRGESLTVALPEEELLLARRRVEKLAGDAGISDPTTLDDDALAAAVQTLATEERIISATRRAVMDALDAVQDELKRRYKEDPTLALH